TGTRDLSGNPGIFYWQNSADYSINVELIPENREIIGEETITYYNNSPDTLKELVMKIFHDFYTEGAARDIIISEDAITEPINITSIQMNNKTIDFRKFGTNLIIRLKENILPNSKTIISVEWQNQLTATTEVRMGTFDESTFFVAYWFPRVAVYDDIDGWDRYNYAGHEFYNDFGNYEVNITIPKNYVVWATGVLQNPEEVFSSNILEKYNLAQTSDEIVHIATIEDTNSINITAQNTKNIWKYKAEQVTDFAFGTSEHFLWDATSVIVDSVTNRRVFIQSAYHKDSKDFYDVIGVSRKTIDYLSNRMPGIPFPYPSMTVFNGQESGGMEFPMMVNDARMYFPSLMLNTTSHEITHTYFPFYCGINETKYAWMDEGWAMFLPLDFQNESDEYLDHTRIIISSYLSVAGEEEDVPMMILSNQMSARSYSYAANAYFRSASAYLVLRNALGEKLFLKALQEYINLWKGKHPIPYDFFNTFNRVAEQDLGWFWKPWFFDFAYPDIAIENVSVKSDWVELMLINRGKMPLGAVVKIYYSDEDFETLDLFANDWYENNYKLYVEIPIDKEVVKIELEPIYNLDVNTTDNIFIYSK
ncbi:MAG: M1 family metallopeptidase, partial [Ignavibacteriales bacterium]|nr:M1 family metallopeptidase [Ignavibacteriales bacterium]